MSRRPRPFFEWTDSTAGAPRRVAGFAHRGGAALWPENTLIAFRGAIALGCRYLETDLHMTRDGELVAFHDPDLERTTDARGPIRARTMAELESVDAGYRFAPERGYPFRGVGARIPRLVELFGLADDVRVNVEIKTESPAVEEALWHLIESRRLHERILIASAREEPMRRFRRLSRGTVATSATQREVARWWALTHFGGGAGLSALAGSFDALQIPRRWHGIPVTTRRLVRLAHRHGVVVHVWTVDEPAAMRRLVDLGVDGVMSDRPDLLMTTLASAREEGA